MTSIRRITDKDREWVQAFTRDQWGSEIVVAHGAIYQAHKLPGFIAEDKRGNKVGLITYDINEKACEIVTLNSLMERQGVGTALIEEVKTEAQKQGCNRLWLITTNDNLPALKFYQKRGFQISAVHPDAVTESRKVKPEIPLVGLEGIPLRDEIELTMEL